MAAKLKSPNPEAVSRLLGGAGIAVAALCLVALAVGLFFWANRGSQAHLDAKILKVRVIPAEDGSAIAVVEVRISNPADALFMVREAPMKAVMADGKELEGAAINQTDLDRLLEFYKIYGSRYNAVIKARDRFAPHSVATDRTVAASLACSAADLEKRKGFVIELSDVDGEVVRVAENQAVAK